MPRRVVFDSPFFGVAERPDGMICQLPAEHVGVVVAVDTDNVQVALVQTEMMVPSGPVMAMLWADWQYLRAEGSPLTPDGMPTRMSRTIDLNTGTVTDTD